MSGLGRHRNTLLLLAVVAITALPLWLVDTPPGEEAFAGADGKALQAIGEIAPAYEPWFKPLLEPASSEIASLLFALQAALGAGVIGYWLGSAVTRERMRKEMAAREAAAVDAGKTPKTGNETTGCATPGGDTRGTRAD
jgi:cobalt/nickel transport protein